MGLARFKVSLLVRLREVSGARFGRISVGRFAEKNHNKTQIPITQFSQEELALTLDLNLCQR